jgi:Spy/CpxP family protein refolding chaperone
MPGPGGPLDLPLQRLNLTDSQTDQVKAIMDSHRDEMKALGDRARAAHDALEAAVTADTVDDTTIRAKSADVAAVDADLAVERARVRAEIFGILTDAQRSEAKQMAADMRSRRPR